MGSSLLFTKPIPEVQNDSMERQRLTLPNVVAPPAAWIEQFDQASGRPFYVNTVTNASAWERPVAQSHPSPAHTSQPIIVPHSLHDTKHALGVQQALSSSSVGSPELFHSLARDLPGVSRQTQAEKIAHDIMEIVGDYPTLHAVMRTFWCEGGSEMRICIKGLVATTYKSQTYQTPITIWLSNRYPEDAPDVYVDLEAAANFIVPPNHPFVDRDGKLVVCH